MEGEVFSSLAAPSQLDFSSCQQLFKYFGLSISRHFRKNSPGGRVNSKHGRVSFELTALFTDLTVEDRAHISQQVRNTAQLIFLTRFLSPIGANKHYCYRWQLTTVTARMRKSNIWRHAPLPNGNTCARFQFIGNETVLLTLRGSLGQIITHKRYVTIHLKTKF